MRIIYNEDLNKRIIPYVDKLIKNKKKLDKETAAAMKKLAKDKMLRALSDQRYASTVYEQEMTQDALLEAVKKK